MPFTTALVGDHTGDPVAVAIYAANLMMAAVGFTLMGQYALFGGELADPAIPLAEREGERRRAWLGLTAYVVAGVLAFVWVPAALVIIAGILMTYFVVNLLSAEESSP